MLVSAAVSRQDRFKVLVALTHRKPKPSHQKTICKPEVDMALLLYIAKNEASTS